MSVDKSTPMFSIFSAIKNVESREAMFRRCIESVLNQTFGDLECVIQDGGSADRTADIVAEYQDPRIRFLSVPDSCGEEGFFRALQRCRGTYIGSCLSDEELLPDALENARRAFEDHPQVAAFYGNVCYVNEKGEKWGPRIPPHPFSIEAYVCQTLVPPFCSSFFRREAVEKAGLHEHHWRYGIGEFEFWVRIAGAGGIIYLPFNISHFGRHSQSNTRSVGVYDQLLAGREGVMRDLFRENTILRECSVSVEQAIAGNYVWGASGVFNIEGLSRKCEYFMQQAERYDPGSPQLARLRSRVYKAAPPRLTTDSTCSAAVRKDSSLPPSGEFARWLKVLSSMDNRLYYRDQSPQTLAALCSLAHDFEPTVIVEIGTLGGLSLRTWLAGTERARIVAVDLSFAKLTQTRRVLPLDLSRVTLLEQDILKTDFSTLWTAQDRVVLFVDAHDLPNVPIMQHVLTKALPCLPEGSLVIVDDLWFSEQRLTRENAGAFLENHVVGEIDELQCFNGHYAPHHAGGSFMGFAEVIPLLEFVNRHGITLVHDREDKHACFTWKREYLSQNQGRVGQGPVEPDECWGAVLYNPLESVPVSGPLREMVSRIATVYSQGKTRQVAESLQQLFGQHPHDQGLCYALAVCLARLGMLSQAKDVLVGGSTDSNHPRYQRLLDDLVERVEPSGSHRSQELRPPADERGLTIFALPKPFAGDIATIQKNAIRSWARLRPMPEIILFGDEPGTRQMAEEIGARHVPEISRNEFGTPLVDKLFQAAQDHASHTVMAYVNADMILFQDFVEGVRTVQTGLSSFLLIGQRWDVSIFDEIDFDRPEWQQTLERRMEEQAMIHPESGLDYFVFRKGLWPTIPPFAIGRTVWDNWLAMDPHRRGVPVVDGTECITAVHQDHDYGHMAGGRQEAWTGVEAAQNRALAGATDGSGRTSGATCALKKGGVLVKVKPHKSWCSTTVYKDERSAWLLKQANGLVAIDKEELAACKCDEALVVLRNLLSLVQRKSPQVESLDRVVIAQRYVSCHTLLAQCYQKMGRYDQVAATYTRLLKNPFVQIPQAARDDIARLRDQAACFSREKRLSTGSQGGSEHRDIRLGVVQTQNMTPSQGESRLAPALRSAGDPEPAASCASGLHAADHRPKVTVITACWNSEEHLPECLDSILGQTMPDWELFLLDDGSTDGTRHIIEEYARRDARIKAHCFDDNRGPYVRRNFAIERASSDFIVIQDADDMMCPDKLERLYRAIMQDQRLGVVGSFYLMFLEWYQGPEHADEVTLKTTHEQILQDYRDCAICDYSWHGSAIIRKRLFEEIGLYDENPFSSDSFWLAKMAELACRSDGIRLKNISEFLTLRRMRADSQTGSLPSFDPRSRRAKFRDYRRSMLSEVMQRLDVDPSADVKAELRKSVCNDFVARNGHLFDSWEGQPLTNQTVGRFISRIYTQFCLGQFVRCINTCGIVERLVEGVAQMMPCYDLTRGLAYFALGLPQKGKEHLEREYRRHGTIAARDFCWQYIDADTAEWTKAQRVEIIRRAIFDGVSNETSMALARDGLTCLWDRRGGRSPELSLVVEFNENPTQCYERLVALNEQNEKTFEVVALASTESSQALREAASKVDFDVVLLTAEGDISRWRRRNLAAGYGRGRFVAFLDQCVWPERDFVQAVLQAFRENEIDGLRGKIVAFSGGDLPVYCDLGDIPIYAACDTDQMCVFRKDVFTSLGGFLETPFSRGAIVLSYLIYTSEQVERRPILYCPNVVVRRVVEPKRCFGLFDPYAMENRFCTERLSRLIDPQTRDEQEIAVFLRFVESLYAAGEGTEDERYERALSNSLFFLNRFPRIALEWAQKALAERQNSIRAKCLVGLSSATMSQPDQACAFLSEVVDPLERLLAAGRVDRSQCEFDDYACLPGLYISTCTLLAQSLMKMGRHEQVAATYTRLLANRNVCLSETRRNDMERLRDRLLAVCGANTSHDAISGQRPNSQAAQVRERPAASSVERTAETVDDIEPATPHAHALAEFECKYRSMPNRAPAKHVAAVRLSELCRRMGQAEKANAYAIQALKIKNNVAFEDAKRRKPSVCNHKPTIVEFNVITRCNAGCIMCNYGPQGKTLELDQFKRLADELLPTAQRTLLIGGEVLLHPDFYAMCEYTSRFGVCLEMTTNLSTLAGNRAEAIRRFFGSVRVSIDGATKQTYESIRTHLSFDRLQENLRKLAEIKRQRPDLALQLAFAAMRQNIVELPDTIEMVARFGFDSVAVSFVHVHARLTLDDSLVFHREEANRYFDLARQRAAALGLRLDIPNNFDLSRQPFLAPERLSDGHKQCVRPWQRVRVHINGDIIPCCRLYGLPMGNAFAEPFERTWNGPKYEGLREAIANSSDCLPAECKHCELITGPTDSNDALLHINSSCLPELKKRLEERPSEQRTGAVACGSGGVRRPKVTVVTACRNGERFLAESLESVRNQSLQEWELLLLDDASTDGTRRIIEEYARRDPRIKPFYFDVSAGPYVRRNFAIERADSDFIVIHDSDDLMMPTKLERLHNEISRDSRLAMVGSFYRTFFEDFKGIQYTDPIELPTTHEEITQKSLTWQHGVSHISAIIRKSMFDCIGGYDENPFASDAFWSAKLAECSRHSSNARVRNIPEYLTLYRVHNDSQTQVLSMFDPRNRRVRYRSYCECKLERIREKMRSVPETDIARELRNCTCSDFLMRFKAHIIRWENEPLDRRVTDDLLRGAVGAFNGGYHVSCVNILHGTEVMEPAISRRIMGFDLLRGMALFALDMRARSMECLQKEIQNHDNSAARKFMTDASAAEAQIDVLTWCQENAGQHDLGLRTAESVVSRGTAPCAGAARK